MGLIQENSGNEVKVIALAGNPNVGKSTVFNALTGMNQHTGNWPGKTVESATGGYTYNKEQYKLVDIPGTYSLHASSAEEEVARDYICFENPDVVVVVVDATCLERNLNLVLQITEITSNIVVCVNLMDEAKKKGIKIDLKILSDKLGLPVVGASARAGEGLEALKRKISEIAYNSHIQPKRVKYDEITENIIISASSDFEEKIQAMSFFRWLSVNIADLDISLCDNLCRALNITQEKLQQIHINAERILNENNLSAESYRDKIIESIVNHAENIYKSCVQLKNSDYTERDRKLDKILTSKKTGIPIMLLLLGIMFWLTIVGANYPSAWLSNMFGWIERQIGSWMLSIGVPEFLKGLLIDGMFRTLGWVVSVMLPPMAIFFPLFTLLEDSGYLPRIAFNMDRYFKKSQAHGKQALTMCMGFGCNACGVTGCRIIDSPRERLIATVTNSFVPCNGRFPILIAIITMFFAGAVISPLQSVVSVILMLFAILLSVFVTLMISKLLSKTVLKGMPSSFALELPPYRRPQIGQVLVRSVFDRTLFVLGRAVAVAAPAGLIIWLLANIQTSQGSLLTVTADFLDPIGSAIGLDGAILLAFILGFPANEIVIPIILMTYLSSGTMTDYSSLTDLHQIFIQNGWTLQTALCMIIFTLFHFPCATTMLTIWKETKSVKWTALSFILPLGIGIILCFIVSFACSLLGIN